MGKRDRHRIEQQARILDAAHRLFSAHGFDEVAMVDVASEAGVARATVFNHFGSKRALVDAINAEVMSNFEAMLENALAIDDVPVPTLIQALFQQMGAGIEQDPRFFRGVFREMAQLQLGFDERALQDAEGAHAALRKLLQKGQERGELSTDHPIQDLFQAFLTLTNGTITNWLYGEADEPLRVRMGRAAAIFLGPVAMKNVSPTDPLPALYEGGAE